MTKPPESTYAYVDRLNKNLADAFGRSQWGDPLIAWKWSGDLLYRGFNEKEKRYEDYRQMELHELSGFDRWLIADFTHPSRQVRRRMGDAIAWPEHGLYISANRLWCRENATPDEATTNAVIGTIRKWRRMSTVERRDSAVEDQDRAKKTTKAWVSDAIDEIPSHIPGKRGQQISWGGYEVPIISPQPAAEEVKA